MTKMQRMWALQLSPGLRRPSRVGQRDRIGRHTSLRYRRGTLPLVQARYGTGGGGGSGGWGGGGGGASPGGSGGNQPMSRVFAGTSAENRDQKKETILLTMSAISVSRAAFSRLTKSFAKYYKEQTGSEVRFRMTYGGSGIQARAVIDGLPADIVALSLPLDVIKIQQVTLQAGLIDPDWQKRTQNNGIYAESVVSIVVRQGNPLEIADWSDLSREGLEIVTANPKTAGVARWNFLALWGHKMQKGDKEARDYVTQVFDRVPVQPRDAREASDVFYKQEVGDALLTYENEVIMTNRMVGEDFALPYVVPDNNIRIECPVALVDKNIRTKSEATQEAAQAFLDYLFTPEAQRTFVQFGFRSVNPDVKADLEAHLPKVKTLWSVDRKLGGWLSAQEKFFESNKILDEIQTDVAKRRLENERLRRT